MRISERIVAMLIIILASFTAGAQTEYYIATGVNVFVPVSSDKKMYPVLGYSRKTDPEVLIGGFGAAMHVYKPLGGASFMKGSVTLGRHVYWEEPVGLRDISNNPLGAFAYSSVDHTLHFIAMGVLRLGNSIRVGTGAGTHVLLYSRNRLPDKSNSSVQESRGSGTNGFYKPLVLVVPVEVSWHTRRHVYAIRYEQALMNRYKNPLAEYRKDLYGIISLEYGWRLFE